VVDKWGHHAENLIRPLISTTLLEAAVLFHLNLVFSEALNSRAELTSVGPCQATSILASSSVTDITSTKDIGKWPDHLTLMYGAPFHVLFTNVIY
jgi:hypothetical protein